MALEKVYDYFHNYDRQTYQVVACMGNEPSEHDIKKFEHQYGINLPADFSRVHNVPIRRTLYGGSGRNMATGETV